MLKLNKVVILTLTDDIYCIGPRRLSAQLKRHGFEVNLVFLTPETLAGQVLQRFKAQFDNSDLPEDVYRQLIDICKDAAIVGMSVWTHQADQAKAITARLQKEVDGMIVWGGYHPMSFPEDCLQDVDGVCRGEGDISLLHLAEAVRNGQDYKTTRGFWFKEGDRIIKNPNEPLVMNLDDLPFLDFEFEDHIVNDDGVLKRMDMKLMKKYYGAKLWTIFSEGCPYKCTFCSNDMLIELDEGYRRFRMHSPAFFMAEVRYIYTRYPHIYQIIVDDDAFMFLPIEVIKEFAAKYRQNFKMPFFVSGVIPASIEDEKFQILMDAGMVKVRVGIQSGNTRIMKEIFVRPLHDDKMQKGSVIAWRNRKKFAPVQYDLIVDNPWEHPEELKDTIRLVHTLKPPYKFALNSLRFFPGSTIYTMGLRDGFVDPNQKLKLASIIHYTPTLPNLTLAFYNVHRIPEFWFRYIMKKDFGDRTVTLPQYPIAGLIVNALASAKNLTHGLMRGDISLMPRPIDLWVARLMMKSRVPKEPDLRSPAYAFRHAVPLKNLEVSAEPVHQ
jgi:anaerobic magnesium-protoporphyrin IX monomethyl ester cyclase